MKKVLFTSASGRLRVTIAGPGHSPRIELDDQARQTTASEALSDADCDALARALNPADRLSDA